jgi:hypothetical protein
MDPINFACDRGDGPCFQIALVIGKAKPPGEMKILRCCYQGQKTKSKK